MDDSAKGHHRSQSDVTVMTTNEESVDSKKDADKKTVKNILSQLLPSSSNSAQIVVRCRRCSQRYLKIKIVFQSPFSSQEHHIFSSTNFPLIVYETEPISIVAYALNSFDYKKSFEEYLGKQPQNSETPPSPVCKKKGQGDRSENVESLEKSAGLLSFLRNKEGKPESACSNQTASCDG